MTTSALTIAKASVAAAAGELEGVYNRLELTKAAHNATAAELASMVAADTAGEADAAPAEVATLRADVGLKAARVEALEASAKGAAVTHRQAVLRLRAETLKASTDTLSTAAVDALVEAAQKEVQNTLRKLAERLQKGADSNLEALEEVRQLNSEGAARISGLSISGDIANQALVIDGNQFVSFLNVPRYLKSAGDKAAAAVAEELAAPRNAERAVKFAAESERDAKHAAERRSMAERNATRIDVSAL